MALNDNAGIALPDASPARSGKPRMAIAKRVAAVSVAAADLDQIKQQLERVKAQLPHSWHWANESEADVLLIDVDSVYGHMDWLRAHSAGRKIIALSAHHSPDHEVVLTRPVTGETVARAFQSIQVPETAAAPAIEPQRAAVAPVPGRPTPAPPARPEPSVERAGTPALGSSAPAVGLGPPAHSSTPAAVAMAAPALEPPPAPAPAPPATELTLLEFFTPEALPNAARIATGGNPSLTIDVASESYFGPTALKPLIPYCTGLIPRRAWEPVSAAVLQGLRDAGSQPLSRLVWLFTLVNSNGQLLPGLDLNSRFKLVKWPQIEREYPKHFRIATIMMKGPASLSDIADQSGAALADVIDFVNAYSATGFVSAEGVPPVAVEPIAPSGLIARLRARAAKR